MTNCDHSMPMTTNPRTASNATHFATTAGQMAYTDTGTGKQTVVFVHGNPASAAEFGPVIHQLSDQFRCIAPDHLGFGESERPTDWDYLPHNHAANLGHLLDSLDLRQVTMVVGDWGGPIGLAWALKHPERIQRLVVTNTWLWPVNRSPYYQGFSKMMGGPLGRYLIKRHNLFANRVVKSAWGTRTPLTPELHAQFTERHPNHDERKGMWVFPREITSKTTTAWLAGLWAQRETLNAIDMELLWGMEDVAFRKDILNRWAITFPHARVTPLDDVGHYVALEATDALVEAITRDPASPTNPSAPQQQGQPSKPTGGRQ